MAIKNTMVNVRSETVLSLLANSATTRNARYSPMRLGWKREREREGKRVKEKEEGRRTKRAKKFWLLFKTKNLPKPAMKEERTRERWERIHAHRSTPVDDTQVQMASVMPCDAAEEWERRKKSHVDDKPDRTRVERESGNRSTDDHKKKKKKKQMLRANRSRSEEERNRDRNREKRKAGQKRGRVALDEENKRTTRTVVARIVVEVICPTMAFVGRVVWAKTENEIGKEATPLRPSSRRRPVDKWLLEKWVERLNKILRKAVGHYWVEPKRNRLD